MNLQEYFKEEPKGSINEMAVFLGVTPTWMSLVCDSDMDVIGDSRPQKA